jgi:hypothetical protein
LDVDLRQVVADRGKPFDAVIDAVGSGVVKGREKLVWSCFGLSVPLLDVFVAQAAIRCLGDDSCAWR